MIAYLLSLSIYFILSLYDLSHNCNFFFLNKFSLIEMGLGEHPIYCVVALQCSLCVATHIVYLATLSLSYISSQCLASLSSGWRSPHMAG
jgi:hypothetical protein